MAANDATCPLCGKPLIGRDRFEGKCAACREKEILGGPAPFEGIPALERASTDCPACNAPNPAGQRACAKCGAPLAPRRASSLAVCILLASLVLVGAVAGAIALSRRQSRGGAERPRPVPRTQVAVATPAPVPRPPAPPEEPLRPAEAGAASRVQQETRELLTLLAAADYERILDNYCQPDEAEFGRVEKLFDQILRGDAADGFTRWSSLLIRLGKEKTIEQLRQAGDPYPDYTVDLLKHLTRDPSASGTHRSVEDRARDVLRWHVAGLFEGLGLNKARIVSVAQGESVLTVTLDCEGRSAAPRPGDDPRHIRWGKLPAGWVLKLAIGDRLEGVRETLKRPIQNGPAPAR